MIRFRIGEMQFRLHVLTLLTGALAMLLGLSDELPHVAAAVCAHELMHIAAARLSGLDIEYIDVMPFGGAAYIRDLYSADSWAIIVTAAAGPLANLTLATVGAAMAWWEVLPFAQAAAMVRVNLTLMLFNLMPALPLDGGRIFYAVLRMWFKPRTALRFGMLMAFILSAGLCVFAAAVYIDYGVINIAYLILAVFVTAGALREAENQNACAAKRAAAALCSENKLPSRAMVVAIDAEAPPGAAAAYLREGRTSIFVMLRHGRVERFVTGSELAHMLVDKES